MRHSARLVRVENILSSVEVQSCSFSRDQSDRKYRARNDDDEYYSAECINGNECTFIFFINRFASSRSLSRLSYWTSSHFDGICSLARSALVGNTACPSCDKHTPLGTESCPRIFSSSIKHLAREDQPTGTVIRSTSPSSKPRMFRTLVHTCDRTLRPFPCDST